MKPDKVKARNLSEIGYISHRDFVSSKDCKKIEKKCNKILESYDLSVTREYDNIIVANHRKKRELGGKLVQRPKPVLVTRGLNGFDSNMVELFNADRLIDLPVKKIDEFIAPIVRGLGFSNYGLDFSIYFNNGVSDTRGYHRDASPLPDPQDPSSFKRLYKFFMYITDVLSIDDGPYSYIPRTHTWESSKTYANHINGKYDDMNEFDLSMNPKIFLEKAGTAIISDQAGFHRGFPQSPDSRRIMLVSKIKLGYKR